MAYLGEAANEEDGNIYPGFIEDDIDLLDELSKPTSPQRRTLMNISLQPSDNTSRLRDATQFLTRILDRAAGKQGELG